MLEAARAAPSPAPWRTATASETRTARSAALASSRFGRWAARRPTALPDDPEPEQDERDAPGRKQPAPHAEPAKRSRNPSDDRGRAERATDNKGRAPAEAGGQATELAG